MQDEPLLEVRDLHVWFGLRRWGFGHAGVVRAVDRGQLYSKAG